MIEKRKRVKKTSGSITIEEDDPEKVACLLFLTVTAASCHICANMQTVR